MNIRIMEWEDLEEAALIEEACFRQSWSKAMLEESWRNAWSIFLCAEEKGRLIAYGNVAVVAGEGEILRIAVLKGFRQRGIGRELLEAITAAAREKGARALTLEVRESNTAARNLYISAGFQEEGRRKDYYREPKEDGIIMWKRGL